MCVCVCLFSRVSPAAAWYIIDENPHWFFPPPLTHLAACSVYWIIEFFSFKNQRFCGDIMKVDVRRNRNFVTIIDFCSTLIGLIAPGRTTWRRWERPLENRKMLKKKQHPTLSPSKRLCVCVCEIHSRKLTDGGNLFPRCSQPFNSVIHFAEWKHVLSLGGHFCLSFILPRDIRLIIDSYVIPDYSNCITRWLILSLEILSARIWKKRASFLNCADVPTFSTVGFIDRIESKVGHLTFDRGRFITWRGYRVYLWWLRKVSRVYEGGKEQKKYGETALSRGDRP